jgi:hypothetical protein
LISASHTGWTQRRVPDAMPFRAAHRQMLEVEARRWREYGMDMEVGVKAHGASSRLAWPRQMLRPSGERTQRCRQPRL